MFFLVRNIPSSFKGENGKIVYLLEAALSRSMRMDSKESTLINFVGRGDLNPVPGLMVYLTSVPCSVSLDVRGINLVLQHAVCLNQENVHRLIQITPDT